MLKKIYIIIFGILMFVGSGFAQTYPRNDPHWTYVWDDDFTTKSISYLSSQWWTDDKDDHKGEPQLYQFGNVSINSTNGVVLTEKGEPSGVSCSGTYCNTWGTPSTHYYSSGSINMYPGNAGNGNRTMQYGYVEATIKIPNNYGLFPAFWLWSCSPYNEVDIFEDTPGTVQSDATQPLYGTALDQHSLTSNIHLDPTQSTTTCIVNYNDGQVNPIPASIGDYASNFHTYGLEWSPSKLIWYIDGQVRRNTINPYFSDATPTTPGYINKPMEIILNLAVYNGVRANWVQNITPPYCTDNHNQSGGCVYDNLPAPPGVAQAPNPAPNSTYYNVPSWYTSINSTSINSTSGTSMYIKDVRYYSLTQNNTCNTNTFTITSTSFNWANPPSSSPIPYTYGNINKYVTFSGTVSEPSSTNTVIRATNSISVPSGPSGASLYVPSGSSLYLDVNPCY